MAVCLQLRNTQSHVLLLLVILLCSLQMRHSVEGRPLSRLLEAAKGEEGEMLMVRALIGSRPPRCERRCITCGHCEAVQVPAVPQDRSGLRHFFTGITSRGDDSSNYKPMSWKCKCGNMIFNP